MKTTFFRKYKLEWVYRQGSHLVAEPCFLSVGLTGKIDPESGMTVNLKVVDAWAEQWKELNSTRAWDHATFLTEAAGHFAKCSAQHSPPLGTVQVQVEFLQFILKAEETSGLWLWTFSGVLQSLRANGRPQSFQVRVTYAGATKPKDPLPLETLGSGGLSESLLQELAIKLAEPHKPDGSAGPLTYLTEIQVIDPLSQQVLRWSL